MYSLLLNEYMVEFIVNETKTELNQIIITLQKYRNNKNFFIDKNKNIWL